MVACGCVRFAVVGRSGRQGPASRCQAERRDQIGAGEHVVQKEHHVQSRGVVRRGTNRRRGWTAPSRPGVRVTADAVGAIATSRATSRRVKLEGCRDHGGLACGRCPATNGCRVLVGRGIRWREECSRGRRWPRVGLGSTPGQTRGPARRAKYRACRSRRPCSWCRRGPPAVGISCWWACFLRRYRRGGSACRMRRCDRFA